MIDRKLMLDGAIEVINAPDFNERFKRLKPEQQDACMSLVKIFTDLTKKYPNLMEKATKLINSGEDEFKVLCDLFGYEKAYEYTIYKKAAGITI